MRDSPRRSVEMALALLCCTGCAGAVQVKPVSAFDVMANGGARARANEYVDIVAAKRPPDLLVTQSGSWCVARLDHFMHVHVGQRVICDWQETPDPDALDAITHSRRPGT